MKKRYSAVDLTDLAIGIIVLGIVVAISANILIQVRDNTLTSLDTITTANETVVLNSSAGANQLANVWGKSVSACYCNQSGGQAAGFPCEANFTLPTANYSVSISSVGGGMSVVNSTEVPYSEAQCTYSWYNTSRADWTLPNQAAIGIAEYGNWFDIIVIVGVAGLILALIFLAFGNRGSQDQGVLY